MVIALGILGLFFGSFVNALVWRIHMQDSRAKGRAKGDVLPPEDDISITKGRSMCPHCRHQLAAKDLVPVFSWLSLRGRCRYCAKPISWQYPVVELATALLFALSYAFWPFEIWADDLISWVPFIVWLVLLVGFVALTVYDLRWMLLPNRLMYPMTVLALGLAIFNVFVAGTADAALQTLISVAIAGGIFYLIFLVSNGRWIGGGDVKLGALIGLVLADPYLSFLMLMTASTLGTLFVLPGMLLKKVSASSRIPFGPFLIVATIIVQLFGRSLIEWYKTTVLLQG